MIEGLKPYREMKDSGVSWLGQVPEHWNVMPNRALFTEINERERPDEDMLSVTIVRGVVRQTMLLEESSMKDGSNLDRSAYKFVRPGDIAYNKMRAWQGAIGVSSFRGIVSPAYVVVRPRIALSAQYFHQLFRTPAFAKEAERWSYGITSDMWSLRPEHFKLIYSSVPPIDEQAAIVRFLNHADGQIRRYIVAKQKFIKLLAEEKRTIIHHAVTRGCDPNVQLKPTGIEWLGDVPEHWSISRVKNEFECLNWKRVPLSSTERGRMTSRQYSYYGASGVIDQVDEFIFDDELLLVAEDGANLVLRNLPLAIIARGKFWVNNHAHILKPKRGNLEFLAAVIESQNFLPWISGAAQPKLTQDRLMSIMIAVPSPEEQHQIVGSMHARTKDLRLTIDHAIREIDFLREYRTRLIADVVTGKLDVRDVAAQLPKGLGEAELLDEMGDLPLDEEIIETAELEVEGTT